MNDSTGRSTHSYAGGFTLVELMISMAIGLVLVLGAITIYGQGRANFRTAENIARIQENARFALELMAPDIRLSGFWGRTNQTAYVSVPENIKIGCGGADVTAWALDLATEIGAIDDGYDLPCPAFDAPQPDTDVLILRHAGGQPATLQPGIVQVQTTRGSGTLFDDGVLPAGFLAAPASATHDLAIHAYYVDQSSSVGGLPSLRRKTLVAGNQIEDQEIIPGVENLQVQFGVDTDNDGTVERYLDPDHALLTPGTVEFNPTASILAVRVWLLVRADKPEALYTDVGPYTPPDADLAPITPNDALRRMQVSTTIYLRNLRGA